MKIIFDMTSSQPYRGIEINGGGEYSLKLLKEILKRNLSITILLSAIKGNNDKIYDICNANNLDIVMYNDYDMLEEILAKGNYNLAIFPVLYPDYSRISFDKKLKIVGIIHDMSTFYHAYLGEHPGRFCKMDGLDLLRKIVFYITRTSKMTKCLNEHKRLFNLNDYTRIYTVSYFSKSAINYFIPNKEVLDVFYSPLKEIPIIESSIELQLIQSLKTETKAYFLMTNVSRWAKNYIRTIMALDELYSNPEFLNIIKPFKVVITGCTDRYKKYIKHKVKNLEFFILRDFVSEQELEVLYKNAFAFIYPSLLEGFGYPPIEAMRYGTLSICSTSTSIPEICGDAVIYFDPIDTDSFKMAVLRSLDVNYFNSLQPKILKRYEEIVEIQDRDLKRMIEVILNES